MAIIVVPLLHTFIIGAGTERKSHEYGDATDAAQNLLEQVQATDVDLILGNADLILGNPKPVGSYANFYTNGTTFELKADPKTADSSSQINYLGITNYPYGDSAFDALITLTVPADTVNNTEVSVSNQMGAYLNMTAADSSAVSALQAECGGLVADPETDLTANNLTRSIIFNIAESNVSGKNTYTIDVLFNYTGTISYTVKEADGEYYPHDYSFTHTEKSSASVISSSGTTVGSPIFSVYMFFNGYYKTSIDETIVINNPTGSDINIFLVNTNTDSNKVPNAYRALVWYKYQQFVNSNPVNNLIFTNLPAGKISYRASRDALYRKTLTVSGYLVELKQFERKFNVNVKLFKGGSGFNGSPILNIDSTKLN